MKYSNFLAFAISLIVNSPTYAGVFTYQCTVIDQFALADDGKVGKASKPTYEGSEFSIDRKTGVVIGPEGALWSFKDSKFSLLSSGSTEDNFHSMAIVKNALGVFRKQLCCSRIYSRYFQYPLW
jgi:hypothetical protein